MTDQSAKPDTPALCTNCGAKMSARFCAHCGQSAEDLQRPAWSLVTDLVDSLVAWEGRFLTTLRALYSAPGSVARGYVDGKRQSYTAPVRLYLIASLVFFLVTGAMGLRVVAITMNPDAETVRAQSAESLAERRAILAEAEARRAENGLAPGTICGVEPGPGEITADGQLLYARDMNVVITLFLFGDPPEGRIVNDATRACMDVQTGGDLVAQLFRAASLEAITDPAGFEARTARAAAQALIAMVVLFALLNLLLHPRTRLLDHLIFSLYWHASFLPLLAGALLLGRLAPTNLIFTLTVAGLTLLGVLTFYYFSERGFYRSSWYGAALRLLPALLGSVLITGVVALGLLFLPLL